MFKKRIFLGIIVSASLFLFLTPAFSQTGRSPDSRDSIIEKQLLMEQEKLQQQRPDTILEEELKIPDTKKSEKIVAPPLSAEEKKAQEAARQETLKEQKKAKQKEQAELKEQKRKKSLAAQEIARDRKARGKVLMREIEVVYKELMALYKKKDVQGFNGKVEIFRALIESDLLPIDYRDTTGHRVDVFQEKLTRLDEADRRRQERSEEKEERRAVKQKEKQERLEVQSVEAREERAKMKAEEKQRKLEALAERREALLEKKQQEREAALQKQEEKREERAHRLFEQKQEQLNKKKSATLSKDISRVDETERNLAQSVQKRKKGIANEKESLGQEFSTGVEELYRKGIEFYKEGRYEQAYDAFSDVDRMWPNYKLTKSYLVMTANIKDEKSVSQENTSLPAPAEKGRDRSVNKALNTEEKGHGK